MSQSFAKAMLDEVDEQVAKTIERLPLLLRLLFFVFTVTRRFLSLLSLVRNIIVIAPPGLVAE